MSTRDNVSHSSGMYWMSSVGQLPYFPDALAPGYTDGLYAVMRQVQCYSSVEASAIRLN